MATSSREKEMMWRARKGKEGEKEPQEPVKSAGKSVGKKDLFFKWKSKRKDKQNYLNCIR